MRINNQYSRSSSANSFAARIAYMSSHSRTSLCVLGSSMYGMCCVRLVVNCLANDPTARTYTTYTPVNPPTNFENDAKAPLATCADTSMSSGPCPCESHGTNMS